MSKNILNDHPWTDSEIAYMHARNRYKDVELNKRKFANSVATQEEPKTLELDQDIYDLVVSLTGEKLGFYLEEVGLEPVGTESELKAKLAQRLQDRRDGNSNK